MAMTIEIGGIVVVVVVASRFLAILETALSFLPFQYHAPIHIRVFSLKTTIPIHARKGPMQLFHVLKYCRLWWSFSHGKVNVEWLETWKRSRQCFFPFPFLVEHSQLPHSSARARKEGLGVSFSSLPMHFAPFCLVVKFIHRRHQAFGPLTPLGEGCAQAKKGKLKKKGMSFCFH